MRASTIEHEGTVARTLAPPRRGRAPLDAGRPHLSVAVSASREFYIIITDAAAADAIVAPLTSPCLTVGIYQLLLGASRALALCFGGGD